MASVPVPPQTTPQPLPTEAGAATTPAASPQPVVSRQLTVVDPKSVAAIQDILGINAETPGAQVIPFPVGIDEEGLVACKTVDEALPLIGNMIKAEKEAKGVKRPYPRTALRHQHIVAFMLCNPFADTTEICNFFSISPTTLNNITKSDTFKSLVNANKVSLESGIGADLQAQLKDAAAAAVEVVQKAIVNKQDPDYALKALDQISNRLGMGAKHQGGAQVNINNTVITPEMLSAALASRRTIRDAN